MASSPPPKLLAENANALKEWAAVCRALETGRQIILLRKGGIHERGGVFRAEHHEFWLYPTFEHQSRAQLLEEAWPWLDEAPHHFPKSQGQIPFQLYAQVTAVKELASLEEALALRGFHVWTEEVVRQRFDYRRPGLSLLVLRVYRLPQAHWLPDLPRYAGCRSWVELEHPLPTAGAQPVLDDHEYAAQLRELSLRLPMGFQSSD
ncbi:hypothetical protein HRbin36_00118 [bacterium HR36]|nr:hypothetical protein HRbin36_00118 [bacterium HR36]